jgi:glutaredoxin
LSDFWPHGEIAKKYGILREEGYTERAIFILDQEGRIRYIDIHDIDEQPDNDVLMDELKRIIPGSAGLIDQLYKAKEEPTEDVVIYCTPWCVDCPKARRWLKENNIPYTEIDISTDLAAARQVRAWGQGFQITPTIKIGDEIILDFKEDRLKELLLNKKKD